MNTIISKRSTPHIYTKSKIDPSSGSIVKLYSILVNGGAGVAGGADFLSGKKQDNFTLVTPEGVATIVDDKTLKKLMDIKHFVRDIDRGYIKVVKGKSIKDQDAVDSAASKKDMIATKDIDGRQITEEDMTDSGAIKQKDGSWNVADADTNNPVIAPKKRVKKGK